MFNKKQKPLIKFVSTIPDLDKDLEILPYPATKYNPSWWKSFPFTDNDVPTIKRCPALPDFFSTGYIVPMWLDMEVDKFEGWGEKANLNANTHGHHFPPWSSHPAEQFIDNINFTVANRKPEMTLKVCSPWYVVTPKGWSVFVMPLWYEFNEDYTIIPGVVDTDVLHQMNHPIIVHTGGKSLSFKKGEPFICYIPFKRTESSMEVISNNIEMTNYVLGQQKRWLELRNESKNQLGAYRKMQRERDYGKK